MAPLVAFRCSLIMYKCSRSFIAENKLVVVVVMADEDTEFGKGDWQRHMNLEPERTSLSSC